MLIDWLVAAMLSRFWRRGAATTASRSGTTAAKRSGTLAASSKRESSSSLFRKFYHMPTVIIRKANLCHFGSARILHFKLCFTKENCYFRVGIMKCILYRGPENNSTNQPTPLTSHNVFSRWDIQINNKILWCLKFCMKIYLAPRQ